MGLLTRYLVTYTSFRCSSKNVCANILGKKQSQASRLNILILGNNRSKFLILLIEQRLKLPFSRTMVYELHVYFTNIVEE